MFDKLEILKMAHGLAMHAGARQAAVSTNIANADTPGYHAQDLPSFADTYGSGRDLLLRQTRDGHVAGSDFASQTAAIDAPGPSSPNGNTVTLEREMVRAVDVQKQHDMALTIYQTSLGVLRTSLGRGR